MDEKEVRELVSRISKDVLKEVSRAEGRSFTVADLKNELPKLSSKGIEQAWTISYDTSSNKVLGAGEGSIGPAAWTISYDTSSSKVLQGADDPARKP